MIEKLILYYQFECQSNDLIKGTDYLLLSYLFKIFMDVNIPESIILSSTEVKEGLNIARATYYKSLENLEFAGIISYEKPNPGEGFEIKIHFISDLLESINKGSSATKDTLSRYFPDKKNTLYPVVIQSLNSQIFEDSIFLTEKASIDSERKRTKSVLLFLKSEKYNLTGGSDQTILFETPMIAPEKMSTFSDSIDEKSSQVRLLLSKISHKLSGIEKSIYYIFAIADTLFLNGELFGQLENKLSNKETIQETQEYDKDKSQEYIKEFQLDDETIQNIEKKNPGFLSRKTEVNGEQKTLLQSWKEWLEYRKYRKNNPVTVHQARKDYNFLKSIDLPITSLEESMRVNAMGIFEVKQSKDKQGWSHKPLPTPKVPIHGKIQKS